MRSNSLPTGRNYNKFNISLQEIKKINMWDFLENLGGKIIKKKSSKFGKFIKWNNNNFWVRFDYKTGYYFYINLTGNDKGTLIDFIQEHIIQERNLGKVKKYLGEVL
jgi:hypothetical protein